MPKIIINADDWGMSNLFNDGILNLIKENIVTSTTIMIREKFIQSEKLLEKNNISIGLHLVLSSQTSKKEIENQINLFKKIFNKLPSHIDGHQHCHISKNNLPIVLETARKYNLPIRSRFEDDRKKIKENKIKTPDEYISWHPKRTEKFLQKLKKIKNKNKVFELVCHPGFFDETCKYHYNKQREDELLFLKSQKFKESIKNFDLINYYEL